jgi:DNA topoisomerase-3
MSQAPLTQRVVILCASRWQSRLIGEALGGVTAAGAGYLECPCARLTWVEGQLLELALPAHYGKHLREWRLEDLPFVPQKWSLVPRKDAAAHLKLVTTILREASLIYIATEPGREGERMAHELLEYAQVSAPLKRLWLTSLDPEGLRKAWREPHDLQETIGLYYEAQTRRRADWLFGINISRALRHLDTLHSGGHTAEANSPRSQPQQPGDRLREVRSYGRLQTPTLALIVARDRAIEAFRPSQSVEVTAAVGSQQQRFEMSWQPTASGIAGTKIPTAEAVRTRLNGAYGTLEVHRDLHRIRPPHLYCLLDLQVEANRLFGHTARVTQRAAHVLYERYRAITYPRTPARTLPLNWATAARALLEALKTQKEFAAHLQACVIQDLGPDAISADGLSHGILPTPLTPDLASLDAAEEQIYRLITERFLQQLLPDYQYEEQRVRLRVSNIDLWAHGYTPRELGWRRFPTVGPLPLDGPQSIAQVADDRTIEPAATAKGLPGTDPRSFPRLGTLQTLNKVDDGASAQIRSTWTHVQRPRAPHHYTEGDLLADMQSIRSVTRDPHYQAILNPTSGLGTPTASAEIIETLMTRGYVQLSGRSIISTPTGRALILDLPIGLTEPALAAAREDLIRSVALAARTAEEALRILTDSLTRHLARLVSMRPRDPAEARDPVSSAAVSEPPGTEPIPNRTPPGRLSPLTGGPYPSTSTGEAPRTSPNGVQSHSHDTGDSEDLRSIQRARGRRGAKPPSPPVAATSDTPPATSKSPADLTAGLTGEDMFERRPASAQAPAANTGPQRCPRCSRPMVWRSRRSDGQGFWGCKGYPSCTTTLNAIGNSVPDKAPAARASPSCPLCAGPMRYKEGRHGPFFSCMSYPKCSGAVNAGGRTPSGRGPAALPTAPKPR